LASFFTEKNAIYYLPEALILAQNAPQTVLFIYLFIGNSR